MHVFMHYVPNDTVNYCLTGCSSISFVLKCHMLKAYFECRSMSDRWVD